MGKVVSFNDKVATLRATLNVDGKVNAGKVNALSAVIKTAGALADVRMHTAAIAALELSDLHGDANSAAVLLNAMPNGSRRETLATWFEKFGNIKVSKHAKSKAYQAKLVPAEERKVVDMAKAIATPFWSAKEKVEPTAFDDMQALVMLQKFLAKAKGDKAALSPQVSSLVATIGAGFTKVAPKELLDA